MQVTEKQVSTFGTTYTFDDGAIIVVNAYGRVPITLNLRKPLNEYKSYVLEENV